MKSRTALQQISEIRNYPSTLKRRPDEINRTFETYYTNLYKSDLPDDDDDDDAVMQNFNGVSNPKLTLEQQENLETQLSLSEITNNIKLTQSGKSPWLDNFPVDFYKKFSKQFAPLLLGM